MEEALLNLKEACKGPSIQYSDGPWERLFFSIYKATSVSFHLVANTISMLARSVVKVRNYYNLMPWYSGIA